MLAAIEAVVRETDLKVLLCPEDETQMAITREMLYEKLPADTRRRVVWRDTFWLPDEAISVYRRSEGLFGHEMHSPIMCIGNGIPAIVCRWAERLARCPAPGGEPAPGPVVKSANGPERDRRQRR